MTTVVVMPGGFHPFHAGHMSLYNSARRVFPDAEVYVAATNDTSSRPFPFAVKEKLAKLAGVEPGHFVQVKSPFRAEEITANFDPNKDTLIFVRSEKDAGSQPKPGGVKKDGSPAYLQPLLGAKKLEPFARHAYMAYLPTVEFGPGMTSATQIRAAWPQLNEKRKTDLVMSLYPKTQTNPRLAATVVKMLDTAIGGQLDEISFFKVPAVPVKKQQEPLGYKHLFKSDEPAPEVPKQYHGWQEYDDENNPSQPQQVKEFAPGDSGDNDQEDMFFKYAKLWYNGNLAVQQRIEQALAEAGWEIGELESEEGGAFIVQSSDEHGDTYMGWSAEDLTEVSENQGWAATFTSEETRAAAGQQGAGMTAAYQRRENQPVDERKQDSKEMPAAYRRDPELYKMRQYAKQHYGQYSDDPEMAMMKLLQRGMEHSEINDQQHDRKLAALSREIQSIRSEIRQQQNEDYIEEKWSKKYKRSIDCSNPKGFSQRAHCQGRKK